MSNFPSDPLVSPQWLVERLNNPDPNTPIRVVDATWKMDRSGKDVYAAEHLDGAVHFDIDAIANTDSSLPHMLPSAEVFAAKVGALGIRNTDWVVVYDAWGLASAASRVWWMFRIFGHERVLVLDGGLPAWKEAGFPVSNAMVTPTPVTFSATLNKELVRSFAQVKANIMFQREQLIDARSAERYRGEAAEPWPGKHVGHVPNAVNLPFFDLLLDRGRRMKSAEELAPLFDAAKIDRERLITVSCGSGVTACVVALALFRLGKQDAAIYDGSWAEWGQRDDAPVMRPLRPGETPPAE